MKAAFILFFAIVLLKAAYGQGDAPAMLQGQYQTSKAVGATIQVANSQVTKINSSTALLETTNNNLLINSGFEHQTYNTSWTVGAGTPSEETSVVFKGKKAFKISLSNQTLSVTQDSTVYASQYADAPRGIAYARVKTTSSSGVKVCPRQAGTTSSTCSIVHSGSGKWELLSVEFDLGSTSNGIAITSTSGVGTGGNPGTVYIDDVYVGLKNPEVISDFSKSLGTGKECFRLFDMQICSGAIAVTPVANTPTCASHTFQQAFSATPRVTTSADTTGGGTIVTYHGISVPSTTGVSLCVYRTNTNSTTIHYIAIGTF